MVSPRNVGGCEYGVYWMVTMVTVYTDLDWLLPGMLADVSTEYTGWLPWLQYILTLNGFSPECWRMWVRSILDGYHGYSIYWPWMVSPRNVGGCEYGVYWMVTMVTVYTDLEWFLPGMLADVSAKYTGCSERLIAVYTFIWTFPAVYLINGRKKHHLKRRYY